MDKPSDGRSPKASKPPLDETDQSRVSDPKIVEGIVDQAGSRWLRIEQDGLSVWIETLDLGSGGAAATKKLTSGGIVVLRNSSIQRLAEAAESFGGYRAGLIAKEPGWIGNQFVYGDGTIFAPRGEIPVNSQLKPIKKYGCKGTLAEWDAEISPLISRQAILKFGLSLPFAGPLLALVVGTPLEVQNPIFETVSDSSTGKSSVLRSAGSILGYDDRDTGFADSWGASVAGTRVLMPMHNDMFLGLDEASMAGPSKDAQRRFIAEVVHVLAHGTEKITKPEGVPNRSFRLVTLSTSNHSLLDMVTSHDSAYGPLKARLISIKVPGQRPYGLLSRLPTSYQTSGEAIDALKAMTTRQYGTPMRQYLQRLVEARKADPKGLIEKIEKHARLFLAEVGIEPRDPIRTRRAKSMALVYAASVLARDWGALPRQNAVGSYLRSFKIVWGWIEGKPARRSALESARRYVRAKRQTFKKVKTPVAMTKKALSKVRGLIKTTKGQRELLIPTTAKRPSWLGLKGRKELKAAGLLECDTDRYDIKRAVRLGNDGKPVLDRFYAIRLDRLKS
ncbi:MAG: DUF927 domain-containing protein [Pseudomonadota bacterium]